MELRQLRYFVKAKELLNFTAAAEQLNISQSTLSQQIKQLETELDTPLFNRFGKRIAVTEAGQLFYTYALQTISKAESGLELLKDLKELKTGKLMIGASPGLRDLLVPALITFMKTFPQVNVEVVLGTAEELRQKLLQFELDFILSFEELDIDKHLKYELLFESPLCLVSAPGNAVAQKKTVTLAEVAELPLILPAKGYSTRNFIEDAFKKGKLHPRIMLDINDIPTLIELIKSGNWYSILARTTIHDSDNLIAIPIQGKQMTRRAVIINALDVYEKKAVKAFYEIVLNKK